MDISSSAPRIYSFLMCYIYLENAHLDFINCTYFSTSVEILNLSASFESETVAESRFEYISNRICPNDASDLQLRTPLLRTNGC